MRISKAWRRALRSGALAALALCLAAGAAGEARGDLEQRFADVPRVRWRGETYYLRGGVSAMLLAGLMPGAAGAPEADFVALFAIDDAARGITPVYIDCGVAICAGGARATLRERFAAEQEPEAGMRALAEAAGELLGVEIDGWMGVDLEGIRAVAELSGLSGGARERLRQLRLAAEALSPRRLNELYARASAHLYTNLTGGAAARAMDSAERYEIAPSVELPARDSNGAAGALAPEDDAPRALAVELFYARELF